MKRRDPNAPRTEIRKQNYNDFDEVVRKLAIARTTKGKRKGKL